MKRYRLNASKTKLVALLRFLGYKPTVKRARLKKGYRSRCWWLSWQENEDWYEALLDTAAGKAFLRVQRNSEKAVYQTLDLLIAEQFDLLEEITA